VTRNSAGLLGMGSLIIRELDFQVLRMMRATVDRRLHKGYGSFDIGPVEKMDVPHIPDPNGLDHAGRFVLVLAVDHHPWSRAPPQQLAQNSRAQWDG
jgi:hypothetical protein